MSKNAFNTTEIPSLSIGLRSSELSAGRSVYEGLSDGVRILNFDFKPYSVSLARYCTLYE